MADNAVDEMDSVTEAIGRLRRAYVMVRNEQSLRNSMACIREEKEGLTLSEGFLALWHTVTPGPKQHNYGIQHLLLCATLLELLLQDYLRIENGEELASWVENQLEVLRGAEKQVADAIPELAPGLAPYEVVLECSEGMAERLTASLETRGIITDGVVDKKVAEALQLGLRKTLVGGATPTEYYTMLAIWSAAADKYGGFFLDACLNPSLRSSPVVMERLGKLDELDEISSWWVVDERVKQESPVVDGSPPMSSPDEQKPCCIIS
eukprot:TRINITY_DN44315_c0_g1_i1.p1 TRINITY_DN44315_c0_g1~~TRINITY_DN44315_c0_g1_i1.p1  ORF type:complete len:265 (-),score=74.86 TRINITY_DN44315_c0_g1_i1:413-1207(-)